MRIGLVGTGQMGSTVERLAPGRGHEVVAKFDEDRLLSAQDSIEALNGAQVLIEFSLPNGVLPNVRRYCDWGLSAVIGTTGWYDHVDEVARLVEGSRASVLYAPNFSFGIALLVRALSGMAPLLERLPEYDAFVHEVHHVRKVDSPSGTALLLARTLVQALSRKERIESETQHGAIDPASLHVTSTRAGTIFGEHVVGLDSPYDRIALTHEARGREGFAFGALLAAEWLLGRKGIFTLDDMLDDWLGPERESPPTSLET